MARKFSKIFKNLSSGLAKNCFLAVKEYEKLSKIEELLEYIDISEHIKKRMENYNPDRNISWEEIKNNIE